MSGTISLGKRSEGRTPLVRELVPLAGLDQLVFGAWDPIADNAYEAAANCGVLDRHEHVEPIADFLKTIEPMAAVFDDFYVKRLKGINVKQTATKMEAAEAIRQDIRDFKERNRCDRLVMIWCASTEIFLQPGQVHRNLENFEAAMQANDESIQPSMIYAWAALMEGVPFPNGDTNQTYATNALRTL